MKKELSGILVSALMMGTVALAESPRRAVGNPPGVSWRVVGHAIFRGLDTLR